MGELLAALLAGAAVIKIIGLIFAVLLIIANWKIFSKAGVGGWKSIIPVYNAYTLYKICWKTRFFWIGVLAAIASAVGAGLEGSMGNVLSLAGGVVLAVVYILMLNRLSRSFGHGVGFTLGLLFLPNLFTLILGFGSSQYLGPQN